MIQCLLMALLLFTGCAASTAVDLDPHHAVTPSLATPIKRASSFSQPISVRGLMPVTVVSSSVTLAWNPDPGASAYSIYYGTESGGYLNQVPVGNVLTATVSNLMGGVTYYFAVTALNDLQNESDFSNEVPDTMPLVLDLAFSFNEPVTNIVVQSSSDLSQWQDCLSTQTNGAFRVAPGFPVTAMFYRASGQSP